MTKDNKKGNPTGLSRKIKNLENKINSKVIEFQKTRGGVSCLPLFISETRIGHTIVDDTYDLLRTKYCDCKGKLDVIVDSGGGDLDAAYNLSNLFRKYGTKELNFIVPRWAKSAATLLVCSGNKIFMTPVAELGPLDPQITQIIPLENRVEQFSPLHIEATLELIRQEFKKGNEKLAQGLISRLQFPLTLGSFSKSLDIAEQYLSKLLSTRMLLNEQDSGKSNKIAKQLTTGYADHGFSINSDEARTIGLKVEDLEGKGLDIIWEIHKLNIQRESLKKKERQKSISNFLEDIPPEILDKLPRSLQEEINKKQQ